MSSAPDWLCAMDDGLTNRIDACTLCGASLRTSQGWYAIEEVAGRALATVCCLPCKAADPQRVRLKALLAARYQGG